VVIVLSDLLEFDDNDYVEEEPKLKYLMFDISNMLYRTFYANQSMDDITQAGLAHHSALTTLNKYYKHYNPHKIIMTFDRVNWRKRYSESDLCYSGKVYKGQRRKSMTPREKEKYELFKEHLADFEEIIREHTSIICLAHDGLEADDLMAGVAQKFCDEGHEIIGISADKDLMQLLRYENFTLVDPATGRPRNLNEFNGDADYFMFQKCLRGDAGDNVPSAYPRIRKTKIQEAYTDPYVCANIMNHTWTDADGREVLVKRMFNENSLMMDLSRQPQCVRRLIDETIEEGFANPGTFNHFKFLRFCGKYELKRISEKLENYVPMLSR
jgi:hypothetical protein